MAKTAADYYRDGLTAYGKKDFGAAMDAYAKALELQPDWSDCLQALGMAQMNAGQLEKALETLTRVTEMAPEDPLAFTSLSMAYVRLEKIEEAEKAQAQARLLSWKQELKENPNAPPPDGGMPVTQ